MSDFEQERGEAVALAEITEAGALEPTIQGVMSLRPGMKLYAHPAPDAGRVAELEARLAFQKKRADFYLQQITELSQEDPRIAALESQLAESIRQRDELAQDLIENNRIRFVQERQLSESEKARERMREALAERLKNAEQAAFEAWFYKECPSGDAAAVQDK